MAYRTITFLHSQGLCVVSSGWQNSLPESMVEAVVLLSWTVVIADAIVIVAPLFAHLESQNVEFMQFAFRWMNCLLMREISVQNTIRMWDTYLVSLLKILVYIVLMVCSFRRLRDRMHFHSFTYTSVQRSLYGGARSYDRWISRLISPEVPSLWYLTFFVLLGHYYVPAVITNSRLGRSRNRNAS